MCTGLAVVACMQHTGIIAEAVVNAVTNGTAAVSSDIRWLLVQFSDWIHLALLLCFRGNRQVCVRCRHIDHSAIFTSSLLARYAQFSVFVSLSLSLSLSLSIITA